MKSHHCTRYKAIGMRFMIFFHLERLSQGCFALICYPCRTVLKPKAKAKQPARPPKQPAPAKPDESVKPAKKAKAKSKAKVRKAK